MKNILIAGAGTMGTHYARNLSEMRDELDVSNIVCVDVDIEKCQLLREKNLGVDVHHIEMKAGALANVVRSQNINGLIGATQTDSHISVLNEALSVSSERPQITRILQEKPFGLFDEKGAEHFNNIVDTVQKNEIRFGMDSILMFSEIYGVFDKFLTENPDLIHTSTMCIYGKNRTQDTRPAHMGIFGTEGTHAIDIARRLGNEYLDLSFAGGEIVQGLITDNDPDVPYACRSDFKAASGASIAIEMSLAFDKNYRQVTHRFKNAAGEAINATLKFDQKGQDSLHVTGNNTDIVVDEVKPSGTKLQNALRSVFGDTLSPYSLDQTLGLRDILSEVNDKSKVRKGPERPVITPPRF